MKIVTRAEWGARAPRSRYTITWESRTEFVVHHSEGPTTQTVRSIQDFHMNPVPQGRGWGDIGYNFLVRDDGTIYEGRGWLVVGAHAEGHNTAGIGVCYIGKNAPTDAAKQSIRALYDVACDKAGRTLAKRGHGQLSGNSTDCPGSSLLDWVKDGMSVSTSTPTEKIVKDLPTLAKGAKASENTETLRALLRARSHPEVAETGAFDDTVDKAVRAVQKWGGVDDDGIVGRDTWAVLLRVYEAA